MNYRIWNTLFYKLAAAQLLLLISLGIFSGWLYERHFRHAMARADQLTGWHVAERAVPYLEKILKTDFNYWELQSTIKDLIALCNKADLYLLDSSGRIIADSGMIHTNITQIPLEEIQKFLKPNGKDFVPIYSKNPNEPSILSVFSVAQFYVEGKKYYIYVILHNGGYESALRMSLLSSVFWGAPTSMALGVGIALIFGTSIFYLLTYRLRKASTIIDEFKQGNFSRRLEAGRGHDEIGLLMKTINSMADEIDRNIAQLKKNDELRRELIANVSHDIRSPATLISGLSEIMLNEENVPASTREKCQLIVDNCKSLNRLLVELFELSKFETKEVKPILEAFQIEEVIEELILSYETLSQEKQIAICIERPDKIPPIIADIGMISRVLTNLIDNAIRYTPENGKVTISIQRHEKLKICVTDTGVGIPGDQLPYVFERFYQIKQISGLKNGLSGLGLAIVKKIIEAHGSEITVRSLEQIGTTFEFELPIATSNQKL